VVAQAKGSFAASWFNVEWVEIREAELKSHTEYLFFETKKRREMVHITDEVERIVERSGVRDGLCFV
jgi:hypothetical protein